MSDLETIAAKQAAADAEAMLAGAQRTITERTAELEKAFAERQEAEAELDKALARVDELERILGEKEKTIDSLSNRVEALNSERVTGLHVRDAIGEKMRAARVATKATSERHIDEALSLLTSVPTLGASTIDTMMAAQSSTRAQVSDAILSVMAASGCDHETAVARLFDAAERARAADSAR